MPSHSELKRLKAVALERASNPDKGAFALQWALQHGDPSMHELLRLTHANQAAVDHTVKALAGRGIRVGWRAEYALTQLSEELTRPALSAVVSGDTSSPSVRQAVSRVQNRAVVDHLQQVLSGPDEKLRGYANEVLSQLGAAAVLASGGTSDLGLQDEAAAHERETKAEM